MSSEMFSYMDDDIELADDRETRWAMNAYFDSLPVSAWGDPSNNAWTEAEINEGIYVYVNGGPWE